MGSAGGLPRNRTILLVEDEGVVRLLLARALAEAGYPVLTAGNGDEALTLASTLGGQLGLVVTDIRMPVMDGLELATNLAQSHPITPVLFISGFRDPTGVLPGPVLQKPFAPHDLVDQVGRMLGTATSERFA